MATAAQEANRKRIREALAELLPKGLQTGDLVVDLNRFNVYWQEKFGQVIGEASSEKVANVVKWTKIAFDSSPFKTTQKLRDEVTSYIATADSSEQEAATREATIEENIYYGGQDSTSNLKPPTSSAPTPVATAPKPVVTAPAGSTPEQVRAISEANGGADVTIAGTTTTTSNPPTGSTPATGSTSTVGGGSGGGSNSGVAGSVLDDPSFVGLPPGAELWKVGDAISVAYQIEAGDSSSGWVYYTFKNPEAFNRAFPGDKPTPKELTQQEVDRLGGVFIGSSNLLRDDLDSGWEDGFMHGLNNAIRTSPWLDDNPETLAEILAATLEGRQIDEDYLRSTSGMSDGAIQYANMVATATDDELKQYHLKYEDAARDALTKAGVRNPDPSLVAYVANQQATGMWTAEYTTRQIIGLSNPYSSIELDSGLAQVMEGTELQSLGSESESVKAFVKKWLGPMADSYSEEFYRSWAGAILDDPNAQDDLTEMLKGQRLALYPEYKNENLSYEDIAGPWQQVMAQGWGTSTNELDNDVLDRIIRGNDRMEANRILRDEGMKRGNEKVQLDAVNAMASAFGSPVVNPL